MSKLGLAFYQESSQVIARILLGKFLIHNTANGLISGLISGVQVDPTIKIHHRHRHAGAIAVVSNIRDKYQLVILAKQGAPIVIYSAIPDQGISLMRNNFAGEIYNIRDMTRSPGSLCRSFGITSKLNGTSLIASNLFIDDRGVQINPDRIIMSQDKKQRCKIFMK